MIVIASYNGLEFVPNLLTDLKNFNISNNKICIVDNKSTDQNFLNYLEQLKKEDYNILHNPKSTYALGAFKYAIDNLKDDVWFGMQDSYRIKQDIFSYVTSKLTDKNMYTFLTFASGVWDSNDDRFILNMKFGTTKYSKGIFASSIFALDSVIQKVKNDWFIPTNKIEDMASERAVSVVFDRHNIEINGLGLYDPPKTSDPNGYPFFSKTYGGRK
jgi:hypothetical protein